MCKLRHCLIDTFCTLSARVDLWTAFVRALDHLLYVRGRRGARKRRTSASAMMSANFMRLNPFIGSVRDFASASPARPLAPRAGTMRTRSQRSRTGMEIRICLVISESFSHVALDRVFLALLHTTTYGTFPKPIDAALSV